MLEIVLNCKMKKMYIFILSVIFNVSNLFGIYEIGDTISIVDQQITYEICYGNYENNFYMIGDANYHLNGGQKKITILKLSASW